MNILFLGGNRFFGKKLLIKISKEKKYKIFIINRGNRKIEKDILGKLNVTGKMRLNLEESSKI